MSRDIQSVNILNHLQRIQDILAEQNKICLLLVDDQGKEITIPSRLPLACTDDSSQIECRQEIIAMIHHAIQEEIFVTNCCFRGLYTFVLKTGFLINDRRSFLIGGRTKDRATIDKNLELLALIYTLPIEPTGKKYQPSSARDYEFPSNELRVLTPQEIKIITLIGTGLSNKEIASQLYISLNTVKAHVSRILRKLQLKNRTDVALFARDHNLVKRDARL